MKVGLGLIALLFLACAHHQHRYDWGRFDGPVGVTPVSHGYYSAGCLEGGKTLALDAREYHVMNRDRNRYYGHPRLVDFIEKLSRQIHQKKFGVSLIGDLSQPRGGPMLEGHASHQVGLDVDIWFRRIDDQEKAKLGADPLKDLELLYLVSEDELTSDWNKSYVQVLQMAAESPEVERIFVHARIKQALCESHTGEKWLRKIRPWWGHDEHFHVRLTCTSGDAACRSQAPPGDEGCGSDLAWWFSQEAKEEAEKIQSSEKIYPNLPEACLRLAAPSEKL